MFRHSTSTAACVMIAATFAAAVQGGDPLMTNNQSFRIPFEVDQTRADLAAGTAVLFVSQDGGPFEKVLQIPATSGGFPFTAPADGLYAFAVRVTDAAGQVINSNGPLQAEIEVLVDTLAPRLSLQLAESGPGQVTLRWQSDSPVTPGSVRLEYAEGTDGRWLPIDAAVESTGAVTLDVSPGTSISVRGFLTDLAGNEGQAVSQLVLTPVPRSPGQNSAGTMTVPQQLNGTVEPQGNSATSLGPDPFGNSQRPNKPGFAAQQPSHLVITQPNQQTANPAVQPNLRPKHDTRPQQSTGTQQVVPMIRSASSNQTDYSGLATRTVRSRLFEIAYQLEDVGPSGVSEVELFVTESNGQQWFRYGKDVDTQSPFQVDARGEGTFGFAVRVKNGVGFSDPPPQPGEAPEIVITVDETAPVIRFGTPQVVATGQGQVVMNWQIIEKNPADSSVRLEYATDAAGPWTPLFDWQADQNGYQMPIPPNGSPALYFRLLARDKAGNVATAQTPTAVIIDQQRPRARLLSVQPAGLQNSF